jgi:hypothetical protein
MTTDELDRASDLLDGFHTKVNLSHDLKHWQKRAEATRAKASVAADEGARRKLLRVAEEYERLAQRAGRRLAAQTEKNPH